MCQKCVQLGTTGAIAQQTAEHTMLKIFLFQLVIMLCFRPWHMARILHVPHMMGSQETQGSPDLVLRTRSRTGWWRIILMSRKYPRVSPAEQTGSYPASRNPASVAGSGAGPSSQNRPGVISKRLYITTSITARTLTGLLTVVTYGKSEKPILHPVRNEKGNHREDHHKPDALIPNPDMVK